MQVSLADTVRSLETRRGILAKELAQIDARLSAISNVMAPAEGKGAGRRSKSGGRTGALVPRAGRRARRSWFERDEASRLLKQAAKSPMEQAALVRALAKAKGYANKLAEADLKRFQGAAYMALGHAMASGKPSRWRQMAATTGPFASVRANPARTARARATNSATAGAPARSAGEVAPAAGSARGGTGSRCSPWSRSGARLAASTCNPGQAARRSPICAVAGSTC